MGEACSHHPPTPLSLVLTKTRASCGTSGDGMSGGSHLMTASWSLGFASGSALICGLLSTLQAGLHREAPRATDTLAPKSLRPCATPPNLPAQLKGTEKASSSELA